MNISEITCLSYQFVFSILVNPIFVSALREKTNREDDDSVLNILVSICIDFYYVR